ncbi:hypothetical protein ACWGLE_15995 [Streptomyces sp. NPDC055897]
MTVSVAATPKAPGTSKGAASRQHYWNGLHVPFIAPWSGESMPLGTIVRRPGPDGEGIAYADEYSRADRRHGVLWLRTGIARGSGQPFFAKVHALRQRQAIDHLLCQVCGASTYGRDDERHLFLVRGEEGEPITEGEKTTAPPICEPCAYESLRSCPHLRKGATAALVGYTPYWGVAGIVYDPITLTPILSDARDGLTLVGFDDPLIRWTLAARLVITLNECTTVDLEQELTTAQRKLS